MTSVQVLAGIVSTIIFASSALPMLVKAGRTKDLKSYSLSNLVLANVGNAVHTVYVVHLPAGPIWVLHGFYVVASALMLHWYLGGGASKRRGNGAVVSLHREHHPAGQHEDCVVEALVVARQGGQGNAPLCTVRRCPRRDVRPAAWSVRSAGHRVRRGLAEPPPRQGVWAADAYCSLAVHSPSCASTWLANDADMTNLGCRVPLPRFWVVHESEVHGDERGRLDRAGKAALIEEAGAIAEASGAQGILRRVEEARARL
jgi:hypothetical protein